MIKINYDVTVLLEPAQKILLCINTLISHSALTVFVLSLFNLTACFNKLIIRLFIRLQVCGAFVIKVPVNKALLLK